MNKPTDEFASATLVPAQDQRAANTPSEAVTVERIERAKRTVARMMVDHDMAHLIETIEFLDAELDKLRRKTAAMDYARELLLENGRNKGSNTALGSIRVSY